MHQLQHPHQLLVNIHQHVDEHLEQHHDQQQQQPDIGDHHSADQQHGPRNESDNAGYFFHRQWRRSCRRHRHQRQRWHRPGRQRTMTGTT
ncbi:MAG: hypothetical protein ACRDPM_18230, partial [Solirubrobacteraceae bacterium]